jgi:MYXO-CTERM domain-containing protein
LNNLAFRNGANYNMLTDTTSDHRLRNNIAFMGGGTISNMVGGSQTFNSWTVMGITVNAMDFLSTMESEATAARQADGSLPNNDFMRLATGSDLIDKGENVGLPFAGSAPDLGPFEAGLTAGTGGMAGTGGTGGTPGGAAGMGMGGSPGGAAGTPAGGAAGDGAGSGAGGAAGIGTGGTGLPTGGTGVGGVATGGVGTGGTPTSGGTGTGGVPPGGGAPAGGSGGSGDDTAEPAGCGCRIGMRHASSSALLALFLAFAALARRRVQRR